MQLTFGCFIAMLRLRSVVLMCFVILIQRTTALLYEGDSCEIKSGEFGICTTQSECPVLEKALNNKEIRIEEVVSCSIGVLEEIICCPNNLKPKITSPDSTTTSTTTARTTTTTTYRTPSKPIGSVPTTPQKERAAVKACREIEENLGKTITQHIINGVETQIGEFPHMAAIGYKSSISDDEGPYEYSCAGSLIHERYVLTAAHCVVARDRIAAVVLLGVVDINDKEQLKEGVLIRIKDWVAHPEYSEFQRHHDIALLHLEKAVNFTKNIYPSCLSTQEVFDVDDTNLCAVTWNTIYNNQKSNFDKLTNLSVELDQIESCARIYTNLRNSQESWNNFICLKFFGDTDSYISGGPLQLRSTNLRLYFIFGLAISDFGQTQNVIFTNIMDGLDFIENTVWEEETNNIN